MFFNLLNSQKGIGRVIFYHKHSVAKALLDLFPNIGLDKTKFQTKRNCMPRIYLFLFFYLPICLFLIFPAHYSNRSNRRKAFEDYAYKNGFDPRTPENWYM